MFTRLKHYVQRIRSGRLKTLKEEFLWVFSYGKAHIWAIIIYTVIGLSSTVISISSSLVSKDLVDIVTGHNTGEVVKTFILIIVLQLVNTAVGQIISFISSILIIKVNNDIRADIYDNIMTSEWESLSKFHSGDISNRWTGDSSIVASGVLSLIPNLIQTVFRFGSALFVVLQYDASFAVFALIGAPVSMLITRGNLKRMRKTNMGTLQLNTKMNMFTTEAFANIQNVKAFNLIKLYSKKIRELQAEQLKMNARFQRSSIFNTLIMSVASAVITYTTYGWGIYKVWSGAITYGTMTMFLTLASSLTASMQGVLSIFPTTVSISNSARRLMDISALPKEDYSADEPVAAFCSKYKADGIGLAVLNTDYAYANGTEVFENVSFEAKAGETVALVGPSGEGKTTMLRLLLALIKGQQGKAFVFAGKDIPDDSERRIPLTASTRQLFSYVPQGNTMFYGTIAENMRFVKEDATDEEIIEALKIADAWEFVEKLPDGINSIIGERGSGFSEGQAQRLSIARALVRKAPILLLDEATSALDVYTEKRVLQNIMRDDYPRTSIVTTHRPSVLSICDRVYSIHEKSCNVMDASGIEKLMQIASSEENETEEEW